VLLVQHHGEFLAADVEGTKLLIEMLEPHLRPRNHSDAQYENRREWYEPPAALPESH
jgi:hypothetical protein